MTRKAKVTLLSIFLVTMTILGGCNPIESIEKKFGIRNEYFEFLNNNNVSKISIQSTRDPGFKFIVTEDSAIKNMYQLLAKSKVSESKSTLEPDYIFEFQIGEEVRNFYYVVGSDEGNFYNDNDIFTTSKRLDEGIIQNLSFIRKPRDFDYIYYQSILDVLNVIKDKIKLSDYNIGINIQGDIECLKYVFSIDLKSFLEKARKIAPNIDLVKNNDENFDLVITVKNRGYDSTNYKTKITVNDRIQKYTDEYFITAVNEFKEWNIKVSEANNKPKDW
ncbi:hypothetical protein H8S10_01755 [Clostridium sp. NSJ-49]|uniref:Putative lipoprotein n=1 Tax=Clostridium disporicum TaxID=84024 RepID=A0A174EI84_9CLOT|nr:MULTISPECIES: hypothetical protein [Clostridium]MBC5624183.1 hypothetical protein [Clostridium sp. NSJ-49]MCD2502575.1 hypothetical protein [Clostridium sp. NSJ-145]CUO36236.1 putative lipoprotein [Clostridium disporicum]